MTEDAKHNITVHLFWKGPTLWAVFRYIQRLWWELINFLFFYFISNFIIYFTPASLNDLATVEKQQTLQPDCTMSTLMCLTRSHSAASKNLQAFVTDLVWMSFAPKSQVLREANFPWQLKIFCISLSDSLAKGTSHNSPSTDLSYSLEVFIVKFCLRVLTSAPDCSFKVVSNVHLYICECLLQYTVKINFWKRVVWLSVHSDPCWQTNKPLFFFNAH